MAVIETWLHQDLQEPVKVNHLDGNLFSNNGNGNRIGVVLTNNGEALASISGTVSGYVVTADGSTVPCTGSKSGNRASILIPAAAYQPGSIFITVFITDGTTVTTVAAVSSTVMRSRTNAQVDPGSVVTDWTQTINAAMQSVETAAANLGGIVAVPYASITFPVPLGKYTYYNNNLYRCVTPIASSESFTAAHWTQVRLGDDVSDLKSAIDNKTSLIAIPRNAQFVKENTNTTGSSTIENNGNTIFDFNKPTGYVYTAMRMGYLSVVGDKKYTITVENNSEKETYINIIIAKGDSWAPIFSPHYFIRNKKVDAGYALGASCKPSDYIISETEENVYFIVSVEGEYSNSDDYELIIRINENAQNATVALHSVTAMNADAALIAKNAGWKEIGLVPEISYQGGMEQTNPASISWTKGRIATLTIAPYTTTSAGFKYIICAFRNIGSLVGHGYKIFMKVHNDPNAMGVLPLNYVCVSNGWTAWGTQVYVYRDNRKDWSVTIDLDSLEGIEELSPKRILFAAQNGSAPASTSQTYTYTIEFCVIEDNTKVIASDFSGDFNIDGFLTIEEFETVFPEENGAQGMIFWGDSLTAGAGGNGTTYCGVCANLLGKSYKNCGVGGETEQTIAARQGGNNLVVPPGNVNGTYTFEQMLDANRKKILPLRQGTGGGTVNPVLINGQSCTLSLSNETYTISGYSGSLLFETNALFSGYDDYADITVIWVGTNGLGTNSVDERISYINSMLSRVGKKYVVMGISMGTEAERSADDTAMALAFGNHFFRTRYMLVNYGLSVAGITPTAQDTADIAVGTVPSSLRSDAVHLNASGYTALGKMLAAHIVGLGYAEYASN